MIVFGTAVIINKKIILAFILGLIIGVIIWQVGKIKESMR
jgi:uncharacterized membrane protein